MSKSLRKKIKQKLSMKKDFRLNETLFPVISTVLLILAGCRKLPVIGDVSDIDVSLLNQNSAKVSFFSDFKGKIVVMSFIYTNCPDICPLITNNFRRLQDTLKLKNIRGIKLILLSFDPNRDTPGALKEYADTRELDLSNWEFLTGSRTDIDTILNKMDVRYFPGDSSYTPEGKLTYYITHTDKAVLIDKRGRIRNSYRASTLNVNEVIDDIRKLE